MCNSNAYTGVSIHYHKRVQNFCRTQCGISHKRLYDNKTSFMCCDMQIVGKNPPVFVLVWNSPIADSAFEETDLTFEERNYYAGVLFYLHQFQKCSTKYFLRNFHISKKILMRPDSSAVDNSADLKFRQFSQTYADNSARDN